MTATDETKPFYEGPLTYSSLSEESRKLLARVPEYPLDYNLFVFKGIRKVSEEMSDELRELRIQSHEGDDRVLVGAETELTTAAQLQDRLMKILILERQRRDIAMLNRLLEDGSDRIKPVELQDHLAYKIKSPLFTTLWSQHYDAHENSFKRLAMLQNLEYEFERELGEDDVTSDDALVSLFCDSREVMEYTTETTTDTDAIDRQLNSEIVQIMIPLAAQSMFLRAD